MLDYHKFNVGVNVCWIQGVFWLGPVAPNHRRTCFGWDRWHLSIAKHNINSKTQLITTPNFAPF